MYIEKYIYHCSSYHHNTNPFIYNTYPHLFIKILKKRQFTKLMEPAWPHRCELCRRYINILEYFKIWKKSYDEFTFPEQTGWKRYRHISSLSMEEEKEEQILDPALGIAARPKICCRPCLDTRRSAQARILLWNNINNNILMAELRVSTRLQYLLSYIVYKHVGHTSSLVGNFKNWHQLWCPPAARLRPHHTISPDVSSHHCDSSCLLPWLCFYKINFRKTPKQRF